MTKHRADRPDMIRRYIADYTQANGVPPSIREIAQGVGLSSTSAVHHHLKALQSSGQIERRSMIARGARVSPRLTAEQIEMAWCLSSHGTRPPRVRPCKRHRLMAEWLAEIVLPKAYSIAA